MLYFAYLDEFGHIGPYVARDDPAYNDIPLRSAAFPYRRSPLDLGSTSSNATCWLGRSGKAASIPRHGKEGLGPLHHHERREISTGSHGGQSHPQQDPRVRRTCLLRWTRNNRPVAEFKVQALYLTVLGEAMKRLNQYADQNNADMVIVMDEHQEREP
jgi:hypothetical protein